MVDKKITLSNLQYYDEKLKDYISKKLSNKITLKGAADTKADLPLEGNSYGDVYLCGSAHEMYIWLDSSWIYIGSTSTGEGVNETDLFAGELRTGTPSNPAEGTMFAQLKDAIQADNELEII